MNHFRLVTDVKPVGEKMRSAMTEAGEGLGDGDGLVDGTSSVSGQTRDQFHVVTYRRPFRFLALAGVMSNRRMK